MTNVLDEDVKGLVERLKFARSAPARPSRAGQVTSLLTEATALLSSQAEALKRMEGERDAWKHQAEHHFGHMRTALDLSYALKYLFDPEFLERVADTITCGDDCENAWREHDTNATGCSKQDTESCPFDDACQLRDIARAVRVQAWTLAFAPSSEANALSFEAELGRKDEALREMAAAHFGVSGKSAAQIEEWFRDRALAALQTTGGEEMSNELWRKARTSMPDVMRIAYTDPAPNAFHAKLSPRPGDRWPEHPVIAVIGPFDNHTGQRELQDCLQAVLRQWNAEAAERALAADE